MLLRSFVEASGNKLINEYICKQILETCRAQNNGRSADNTRPKIVFVRPNLAMTGHDVRSLFFSLIALYIACYHTAETYFQPFLSHMAKKIWFF